MSVNLINKNLTNRDLSKGVHRVLDVRPFSVRNAERLKEIEENKTIVKRVIFSVILTAFVMFLEYGL